MPNWCENRITIRPKGQEEVDRFLQECCSKNEKGRYEIDFDKIIPEPRRIEDCPADCIANDKTPIQKDEDRPWFNWYDWRVKFWGTKWNADTISIDVSDNWIAIAFNTPWEPPMPIIKRLMEMFPESFREAVFLEEGFQYIGKATKSEGVKFYEFPLENMTEEVEDIFFTFGYDEEYLEEFQNA